MTDSCQGDWEYMDKLVNRFLSWTLPKSVCSDTCVSDPNYQHARYGTNLLTADEAKEMLEHVLEMTDSCQKGEKPREWFIVDSEYENHRRAFINKPENVESIHVIEY